MESVSSKISCVYTAVDQSVCDRPAKESLKHASELKFSLSSQNYMRKCFAKRFKVNLSIYHLIVRGLNHLQRRSEVKQLSRLVKYRFVFTQCPKFKQEYVEVTLESVLNWRVFSALLYMAVLFCLPLGSWGIFGNRLRISKNNYKCCLRHFLNSFRHWLWYCRLKSW